MHRQSIQYRLIAAVIISQLVMAVALALFGVWYTRHRLISTLDATLQARAISVAALVRYPEDESAALVFEKDLVPMPLERHHPDLFQVKVNSGTLVARSPDFPGDLVVPADASRWTFHFRGASYRGVLLKNLPILDSEPDAPKPPPTLFVIYAVPMGHLREEVAEAGVYLGSAALLALMITVAFAVFGIRRGLRPLQELTATASRVSPQNWEMEEPREHTQELIPLTRAMQTMLDGLHRAFSQQREFLGNAAHELKTPLAIVKSTLQSTLQKPRSSEEYRTGLEQALEDLDRVEMLLNWMLRLARAEQWAIGAVRRDLEIVSIAETLHNTAERLLPLAKAQGVSIRISAEQDAQLRADPEDLQLVWANLMENGIRYGAKSGLEVGLTRGANSAIITVSDRGPGIPPDELPFIFDRFYRADRSRARDTGGFGLGLAICRALVEAYGGTITASSKLGEGTSMTVELPTAALTDRVRVIPEPASQTLV